MGKRLLLMSVFLLLLFSLAFSERIEVGTLGEDVSIIVEESNDFRTVVRFEIGAFDKDAVDIDGQTYYSIKCGKEGVLLNAGEPALPRICRSIIIPDDARMEINIISSEYIDYPQTPVVPSKGNLLRTVNPDDVPYTFESVYSSTQPYPGVLAEIREPFILRDFRGTVIELNAFQYLPAQQTLRVFTSVTVEVVSVGSGEINVISERKEAIRQIPDYEIIYQRRFINYETYGKRYTSVDETGDLLIITYDAFHTAMMPLMEWKLQKGIKTTIVDVSTIPNNSTAIASFIQDFYDSTDLVFVLLVGDAGEVATPSASGGSSDPSYAKVAGGDDYPDIFIGRFSAQDVSQVETQVQRTITYELDPLPGDWFHKGTGVASAEGPGHNGEYDWEHSDLIRDDLLAFTYTLVDQIYDPGATSSQVTVAMNDGRSIANYTGHGGITSWGTTGFSNSNVDALTNDNMLPFIISVACYNGVFDGYTCFGEAWLRATNGSNPTGAIGAYMASIGQSWNPPMDAQDEIVDLLIVEAKTSYGGLCFNGSCKMIEINGAGGVSMYNTWHIFGDPSVQVRTDTPAAMTVNHAGTVFFNHTEYQVEVVGVQGALCALYFDGTLYGSAYTGVDGIANIQINESLPFGSTITLTVTAFNKETFVDDVVVTSEMAIIHTPLPDTKNTDTPYEVWCSIYSNSPLKADSLLLRYEIASTWYVDTLIDTIPAEDFVGYIPPQPAGTIVNYYIFACNEDGNSDSTEVYTFRVIDYALLLDPLSASQTAPVDDTVWYTMTVTNDGVLTDQYTLDIWGYIWDSSIWDETGTTEISSIGPLARDESADFKVRVIVPVSVNGESDIAYIKATSDGDPSIMVSAILQTYSAGQPLAVPFVDQFVDVEIDTILWGEIEGVTVSDAGIIEPSTPYSLNFDGDPDAGDVLTSKQINVRGLSGINISYYYQRTGGGNSPEAEDDLFVEYLNDQDEWLPLNQHLGSGSDMTTFELVTIGMPLDGYHAIFRLRFRNTATSGPYDDWFVDDVRIDYGPAIAVQPGSYSIALQQADSTEELLIIENTGPGELSYSIDVAPDFSRYPIFNNLLEAGQVNPARCDLPDDEKLADEIKGFDTDQRGPDVIYDAGGPDLFGYFWVDSDESGGPVYDWIDILASGTEVTGLDDDNFVGPFPIGFDFPFYGNVYNEFYIASNGFIGFGSTTGFNVYNNTSIPNTSIPNNAIYWCWDDLDITSTGNPDGKVVYENTGGGLVLQFDNYPEHNAGVGDVITAELILYPNGNIKMQYKSIAAGFDVTANTIGLENETGDDALQVSWNTTYLHDELAISYTKPAQWLYFSSSSGELLTNEMDTITVKFSSVETDTGTYNANIRISSNDPDPGDNPYIVPAELVVTEPEPQYVCGDADGNDLVEISDVIWILNYVLASGPPPEPLESADVDCNGTVEISDAVYLVQYIFTGGPEPCADCP